MIEKEEKPRFSWWRDVAEAAAVLVFFAVVTAVGVEAISHDLIRECTVCFWERIK